MLGKFSWCLDSRAWRIVITFVVIFANVTVKCRGYGWLKERQGWLFREVAVIFLSTSLLFFIKIMCTTSKRDVGLARSLKYLSLKGYKILMEVWCSDGEGFFFFFFFLKNTYNHTSHMFRCNWSIPALQFCWTFYLCNRGLAFNLNWLCRKAKGSLRGTNTCLFSGYWLILLLYFCVFLFLFFSCPCTRISMDFAFVL